MLGFVCLFALFCLWHVYTASYFPTRSQHRVSVKNPWRFGVDTSGQKGIADKAILTEMPLWDLGSHRITA